MNGDVTIPSWALVLGGAVLLAGGAAAGYALADFVAAQPLRHALATNERTYQRQLIEQRQALGMLRAEARRARAAEKGTAQRLRELINQQRRERNRDPE